MKKLYRACSDVRLESKSSHPTLLNGVAGNSYEAAVRDMVRLRKIHGGNWWIEKLVPSNVGVGERWIRCN